MFSYKYNNVQCVSVNAKYRAQVTLRQKMFNKPARHRNHALVRQIKYLVRQRFALDEEDVPIFVAEIACGVPGCPPLETVIAFWTAPDRRHTFKVFKPLIAVTADDLPPSWMKDALLSDETVDCC
jgi:hypothetical protein